jgi:peptidoglycan L-alanyl-D-glutamate endopeptidase CwlK
MVSVNQEELEARLTATTRERLKGLDERFRTLAYGLCLCGQAVGLDVQVSSGRRSRVEQETLYAIGRTKPGKIVTNARFGESAHNFGLAVDVFVRVKDARGGYKADWSPSLYEKLWAAAQAAGLDAAGLAWAGNWKGKFKELVHFELAGWRQLD